MVQIIGPWIGEYKLFNKYQKQKAENVLPKLTEKITLKLYYGIYIVCMIELT